MGKHMLHAMTYEEAREYFSSNDTVILPIGSVEQHGPANPLGTDTLIAEALAREASRRSGVASLPAIPIGVSFHHMGFHGTITVSERALEEYLFCTLRSLVRWGVKRVVVVNGHGGNLPTLQILARRARDELGVGVFIYQWWTSSTKVVKELFSEEEGGHAAAAETSLNMYLNPEYVRSDRLVDEEPRGSPESIASFRYTHELSDTGVFGKQTTASPERGRQLFERLVEDLVEFVSRVKRSEYETRSSP